MAARAAYRAGSPAASGATALAVMMALVASGPVMTCLEVQTGHTSPSHRGQHTILRQGDPSKISKAIAEGTKTANTVIATINSVSSIQA